MFLTSYLVFSREKQLELRCVRLLKTRISTLVTTKKIGTWPGRVTRTMLAMFGTVAAMIIGGADIFPDA